MADVMDKPCPFCGGTNTIAGGDDKVCGIFCSDCGAGGPNGYQSDLDWNDRARLSELEAGPAGGGVVVKAQTWRGLDDARLQLAVNAFYEPCEGTTIDGVRAAILAWEQSR